MVVRGGQNGLAYFLQSGAARILARGSHKEILVEAPIIDMRDVYLSFSDSVGVRDLTISVAPGTIFGLIGPSGSGKTTCVRLMTGIYRPDSGDIRVLGHEPYRFGSRQRERIGYLPQQFVLYQNLTVWENLNFAASLYGMGYLSRRKHLLAALDFVELSNARSRLGGQLSGGMQRRLSLACALVHQPSLIFADEPTAGIDPVLRDKFWRSFRDLRDAGRTLVITTQYVGEAAYCDLVGVMADGQLIHVDTPAGLRRTALGGEVIRLLVDDAQRYAARDRVQSLPFVRDVRRSREAPGEIYIYVDHASEALPAIFAALREEPEIAIRSAEEYQPPFDDLFVALMQGAGRRQTENAL
jgi:ABC-2 type transport system ATP-binding protein